MPIPIANARPVVLRINSSLDDYTAGPKGELDWLVRGRARKSHFSRIHSERKIDQ